jgi:hypothetical protein
MSLLGGVFGSLVGGIFGKKQADRAADAQVQASQAAIAEQRRQFDTSRADAQPWMQAGQNALANLQNPDAFQQSPGYNFLREQGMQGIERSAAARGGAASGNALKALAQFQTGLAQQDFGNWWNRQAGLAGVGQNAQQGMAQLGAGMAGNVGNALINSGEARASGITAGANSLSQGIAGAFDAYNYFRTPRPTQPRQPWDHQTRGPDGPLGGGYGTGW